jgi:hypothetical protein
MPNAISKLLQNSAAFYSLKVAFALPLESFTL